MKNNVLLVVFIILIGILTGVTLLNGINTTVQMAQAPVILRLTSIEASQKLILQKLEVEQKGDISSRLANIEDILKPLKNAMANAPGGAGGPGQMPRPPQEDLNKVYKIDIGHSPVQGKKDAPITIVQFTDLQCPFCARFYPALKEVLKAYPDKVKVVIKNFPLPFHPNARPAAKLALAANEQGKYFEMVDLLLQNGADVSEAKVKDYAKELKINYDQLNKDLKANEAKYEQFIVEDSNLVGQVDVQGTPTFFINGKKTMARDFNGYKAEIDKILAGK